MPKPRKQQVSVEYHCVSRCVSRAFICGTDPVSGQCYEHRRGWLEERILALPQIFAIQVAAYAMMLNHYHAILFVDSDQANGWSAQRSSGAPTALSGFGVTERQARREMSEKPGFAEWQAVVGNRE
jgi:hypothetical protein